MSLRLFIMRMMVSEGGRKLIEWIVLLFSIVTHELGHVIVAKGLGTYKKFFISIFGPGVATKMNTSMLYSFYMLIGGIIGGLIPYVLGMFWLDNLILPFVCYWLVCIYDLIHMIDLFFIPIKYWELPAVDLIKLMDGDEN